MSMTQKERIIAQIEHRETDFVPYVLGFETELEEQLDEYYGSDAWRGLLDNAIRGLPLPIVEKGPVVSTLPKQTTPNTGPICTVPPGAWTSDPSNSSNPH